MWAPNEHRLIDKVELPQDKLMAHRRHTGGNSKLKSGGGNPEYSRGITEAT